MGKTREIKIVRRVLIIAIRAVLVILPFMLL